MASHDELDPLGTDWKSRSDRGTAILREIAIEEAAGKSVPLDPLTKILADLAGRVSGILQAFPERVRDLGANQEMVNLAAEIVADCQVQISVSLDNAADEAMGQVDAIESAMVEQSEQLPLEEIRGPKERRKQTHKGKPTTGNMKPKAGKR